MSEERITTVKKTTVTYDTDITGYRPGVTPRSVIIQRSAYQPVGSASRGYQKERSVQYGSQNSIQPGSFAVLTNSGVSDVKASREREKKDMQDLNERFASYIEKVRFLEAQNRRLADELEKLKSKWGKETTQIKAMYQAELDEARKLLDDAEKEKARLEIRIASLEEINQELRQRLEDANKGLLDSRELLERQNQQLADFESEVGLLRRRMELLETDRDKDKKLINTLQETLNRTRADLDNETLLHIDAENRRQTLEEEIEFLKTVHDQELKELAALAYRDTTAENRDFWKNEMGQALREIQQVYDDKLDLMRHEIEQSYNFKLQEFRTGATKQNIETVHSKEETKRLKQQLTDLRDKLADLDAKNLQLQRELEQLRRDKEEREKELELENNELKVDIAKLRAEMEAVLRELQYIMDAKLGLELEIAAYRKLLEGEESRIGLRNAVDMWNLNSFDKTLDGSGSGGIGGGASSSSQITSIRGEMSAKTTYQRSAKGPISIAECAQDGKYITLENTGRNDENITSWKITRNVDGEEKLDYVFPDPTNFGPGAKIKVWSKDSKPQDAPATDLEVDVVTFGIGANITTKLFNTTGEDRATHIQKTVYA